MDLRPETCYRALELRDARFDGRFFTGVVTTGIYCRPVCPSRTPRPQSCLFFASAAAAQAAGFRPCLRCRPEVAPHLSAYRGTASLVSRALRLLDEGALDEARVEALADKLGVGQRQLRRLFLRHLGAPPVAVAQARRALLAKALLQETSLPVGDVALAAGFGSLRRFNEVMKHALGRPPSEVRRAGAPSSDAGLTLRLPFAPPYDWPALIGFFGARAVAGVEAVADGAYRRTLSLDGAVGTVEVRAEERALAVTLRLSKLSALAPAVARLRRVFDLDADAPRIGRQLAKDALLAPMIAARPGLRVPGAWDPFELAVRAILGQQISVAGARTLAGRLVEQYGESLPAALGAPGLQRLFPTAQRLAGEDLSHIGLPKARAKALSSLAAAVAQDPSLLGAAATLEQAVERLVQLPGIGPWTAQYIALRALREPDAFPTGDLGLLRASGLEARALDDRAEAWRPFRAYAALHLWTWQGAPARQGADTDEGGTR